MDPAKSFYFGNAVVDQVRDSGWFVGQFVPAELGLRHRSDVEVKWGIHPDGEKRPQPWANGHATTISVLIHGTLRVTFHVGATPQIVTLQKGGTTSSLDPTPCIPGRPSAIRSSFRCGFPRSRCGERPGPPTPEATAGRRAWTARPRGLFGARVNHPVNHRVNRLRGDRPLGI